VNRDGWLPKYRFYLINGNVRGDILAFCQDVTERWRQAWQPGNTMMVDESVYEFLGESPCHVYFFSFLVSIWCLIDNI